MILTYYFSGSLQILLLFVFIFVPQNRCHWILFFLRVLGQFFLSLCWFLLLIWNIGIAYKSDFFKWFSSNWILKNLSLWSIFMENFLFQFSFSFLGLFLFLRIHAILALILTDKDHTFCGRKLQIRMSSIWWTFIWHCEFRL